MIRFAFALVVALSPSLAHAYGFQCTDTALRAAIVKAMAVTGIADAQRLALHAANRLGRGPSRSSTVNPEALSGLTGNDAAHAIADQICYEIVNVTATEAHAQSFFTQYMPYGAKSLSVVTDELQALAAEKKATTDPAELIALQRQINLVRHNVEAAAKAQLLAPGILNTGIGFQSSLNEFWFNHFNVTLDKATYMTLDYIRTLRTCQGGTFRELLGCSGKHPGMLRYLDQFTSVGNQFAGKPYMGRTGLNENYARELLELHTLGTGPRPRTTTCSQTSYNQTDVTNVARILTGWGVDTSGSPKFIFRDKVHDDSPAANKTAFCKTFYHPDNPSQEAEELLDVLASNIDTKRNICKHLVYRYLGRKETQAADAYNACIDAWGNKGDLTAIYKALVTSPDMWDRDTYDDDVKDPITAVISLARSINVTPAMLAQRSTAAVCSDPKQQVSTCYSLLSRFEGYMLSTGLQLANVGPPTGYDEVRVNWASPALVLETQRLAFALGRFHGFSSEASETAYEASLWTALSGATDPEALDIIANRTVKPLYFVGRDWLHEVGADVVLGYERAPEVDTAHAQLPLRTLTTTYLRSRPFLTR